jgi:hypothetical protein
LGSSFKTKAEQSHFFGEGTQNLEARDWGLGTGLRRFGGVECCRHMVRAWSQIPFGPTKSAMPSSAGTTRNRANLESQAYNRLGAPVPCLFNS